MKFNGGISRSKAAKGLRIKVTPTGIDIVVPKGRLIDEAVTFVSNNQEWVIEQLRRARQIHTVRRPDTQSRGQILFCGVEVPVNIVQSYTWQGPNKVLLKNGVISIIHGSSTQTPVMRSLENWLRKQARESIDRHIVDISKRVKRSPNRVYIMDQRTKWGNCSALGNLSFNWRLIMAPDYVLRYIVTHEMVHLVIPDHSQKFWLTVYSLCHDAEKARQWLVRNSTNLFRALQLLVPDAEIC